VLDIGCANGYSTLEYLRRRSIKIHGVDYVPEMIECAKKRVESLDSQLSKSVVFEVGSVLNIPFPDEHFDKVISTRVVINLGNWESQKEALNQCVRVTKKGGKLLLSEATVQGLDKLNKLRREFGLEPIPIPSFNLYLDQDSIIREVEPSMELLEIRNFASTYFWGTRFLKPILAKLQNLHSVVPDPLSLMNEFFSLVPSYGDFGTQKLFVFRKK